MQCPKCGSSDQLAMQGDVWLCLDCRNEYNAADGLAAERANSAPARSDEEHSSDVERVLHAATADEVLAVQVQAILDLPDEAPEDGDEEHVFHWAGQFVRRIGTDDIFLCLEDELGESIAVQGEDGPVIPVHRRNYELVGFDPDALAPVVGAETVTEDQPFDPAIFAVAALAITQGLACLGTDEDQTLNNPRIGWLPPPCNQVPEVEQGVAYAIALLVRTYQLDRDGVEQIAATLMEGAQAPESETVQ